MREAQKSADGDIYASKRFPAKTSLANVGPKEVGFVRGSERGKRDEVPIALIRSGSFTLNIPPNMLITIANIKAILVKV